MNAHPLTEGQSVMAKDGLEYIVCHTSQNWPDLFTGITGTKNGLRKRTLKTAEVELLP